MRVGGGVGVRASGRVTVRGRGDGETGGGEGAFEILSAAEVDGVELGEFPMALF